MRKADRLHVILQLVGNSKTDRVEMVDTQINKGVRRKGDNSFQFRQSEMANNLYSFSFLFFLLCVSF